MLPNDSEVSPAPLHHTKQILHHLARRHCVIYYRELAGLIGLDVTQNHNVWVPQISQVLRELDDADNKRGKPRLATLVVRKSDPDADLPGEGYWRNVKLASGSKREVFEENLLWVFAYQYSVQLSDSEKQRVDAVAQSPTKAGKAKWPRFIHKAPRSSHSPADSGASDGRSW